MHLLSRERSFCEGERAGLSRVNAKGLVGGCVWVDGFIWGGGGGGAFAENALWTPAFLSGSSNVETIFGGPLRKMPFEPLHFSQAVPMSKLSFVHRPWCLFYCVFPLSCVFVCLQALEDGASRLCDGILNIIPILLLASSMNFNGGLFERKKSSHALLFLLFNHILCIRCLFFFL